jgi:hypothetical protein
MRFMRRSEDKRKSPFEASVLIDKPDVKVVTASYYQRPFFIAMGTSEQRQVKGMAKMELPVGGEGKYQSQTVLKWNILYNPKVLPDFMPIERIKDLVTSTTSIASGSIDVFRKKTELTEAGASEILRLQKGVPRTWELIAEFIEHCKTRRWKTLERDDLVKIGDKNHHFLWTQTISPNTFEKISKAHKIAARIGKRSYRVIDIAYTAWLFSGPVSSELYRMVKEQPEFTRTIAIYDISKAHLATPTVIKLNETDSEVFREFEYFSQNRWNLKYVKCE